MKDGEGRNGMTQVETERWWNAVGSAVGWAAMTSPVPPLRSSASPEPLDDRLIRFAVAVCDAAQKVPATFAGPTVIRQLVRSGTSPAANYAEARGAVSGRDYVHKMQLCLKELRETMVWLKIAHGARFKGADYGALQAECNELIAIVVTCVKKAKGRL